jgi:DNA modification methylase
MEYENQVLHGVCLDVLRELPASTFHACVTDPPYGLGDKEPTPDELRAFLSGERLNTGGDFMGEDWEIPSIQVWEEVFRVLRPGGYVLTFGGTRTWDLISMGCRMAGFEMRDTLAEEYPGLQWLQAMGMPHGLDISKAIDKDLGVEREVVGTYRVGGNALTPTKEKGGTYVTGAPNSPPGDLQRTVAGSDEARGWEGWNTNLKPAWEPILIFRKPLDGAIVENIRKWGCGAINIDGCRIFTDWQEPDRPDTWKASGHTRKPEAKKIAAPPGRGIQLHPLGRYPANVVFVEAGRLGCPVGELEDQKTDLKRYFNVFPVPFMYEGKVAAKEATLDGQIENNHNTKKPLALMKWLVRLVCPKDGIVLDPYCGSGTTLHAAVEEGMRWTGIERDPASAKTAQERVSLVLEEALADREDRETFMAMASIMDEFDDE